MRTTTMIMITTMVRTKLINAAADDDGDKADQRYGIILVLAQSRVSSLSYTTVITPILVAVID